MPQKVSCSPALLKLIIPTSHHRSTYLRPPPPSNNSTPTMKFLLLLSSTATLFTGSFANDATTDNRQLQWNPNCGTVSLWHPDYTAGWSGGFCSQQVTCNSPSYDTAAECCSFAYAGQGSHTCYTAAGIPVPTPAPVAAVPGVPAAGTWYRS